jgi:hypothetical protein
MDSDKDNDDPKLSGLGVVLVREVQVQQDNRKIESNSACLSFKTRLYMICKTSLVSAVVAQPGRALDLLRGEAEDRAVVSSNLTDGILHLFCGIYDYSSGVLNYQSRGSQMVLGVEYSRQFLL